MIETFFTEKRIIKKIIIVLVFIVMFNFTFSYLGNNVVFAEEGQDAKLQTYEEGELEDGEQGESRRTQRITARANSTGKTIPVKQHTRPIEEANPESIDLPTKSGKLKE